MERWIRKRVGCTGCGGPVDGEAQPCGRCGGWFCSDCEVGTGHVVVALMGTGAGGGNTRCGHGEYLRLWGAI